MTAEKIKTVFSVLLNNTAEHALLATGPSMAHASIADDSNKSARDALQHNAYIV